MEKCIFRSKDSFWGLEKIGKDGKEREGGRKGTEYCL